MDPITLYAMVICQPVSIPCGAPFSAHHCPAAQFAWQRDRCLAAARGIEKEYPKDKVYCVGRDGVVLNASGAAMDAKSHYEALDRWFAEQDRQKQLSAGAR